VRWKKQQPAYIDDSSASLHDIMADLCEISNWHFISLKRGKILDWIKEFDNFQKDPALWSLLVEQFVAGLSKR